MKPLSELKISPAPWSIEHDEHEPFAIMSTLGIVCDTYYNEPAKHTVPDARLIAASPKLYECLREAIAESCISYCGESPIHCPKKLGECFVQKWRAALAEAAGEEVRDE